MKWEGVIVAADSGVGVQMEQVLAALRANRSLHKLLVLQLWGVLILLFMIWWRLGK
jgi:hypothetical protein